MGLRWHHIDSQWTWIPDEGEPDVPPAWQPKPADNAISLDEMLALQKVDFPTMQRVYLNPSEASVLAELIYGSATTPDGWIASTREASENRMLASDRAAEGAKLAQYAADPTALDVDVWNVNAKRAKLKLFMLKSKLFAGYVKVVGPTADLIMLSESIPFLAAGGISSAIRNDAIGSLQTLIRGGSALTEQGRGQLAQYFSRFALFQRELKDVATAGTRAYSLAFDPAINALRVGEGQAALEFEMKFGTTLGRSANAGADFVGSQGQFAGKTFDFVGAELKSEFFKLQGRKGFAQSITDHLGTSDYTVLYLRRLTPSQVQEVSQFLTTLSATDLAKILVLK